MPLEWFDCQSSFITETMDYLRTVFHQWTLLKIQRFFIVLFSETQPLSIHPSTLLSFHLPIDPSIHSRPHPQFTRPSIHFFIQPFIFISIHPTIHQYTHTITSLFFLPRKSELLINNEKVWINSTGNQGCI